MGRVVIGAVKVCVPQEYHLDISQNQWSQKRDITAIDANGFGKHASNREFFFKAFKEVRHPEQWIASSFRMTGM